MNRGKRFNEGTDQRRRPGGHGSRSLNEWAGHSWSGLEKSAASSRLGIHFLGLRQRAGCEKSANQMPAIDFGIQGNNHNKLKEVLGLLRTASSLENGMQILMAISEAVPEIRGSTCFPCSKIEIRGSLPDSEATTEDTSMCRGSLKSSQ